MDKCIQKIFNKKLEKEVEKDFIENKKQMKLFNKYQRKNPIGRYIKLPMNKTLKNEKKKKKEKYKDILCNPTCKDTIFEAGDPNKLTPSFIKKMLKEKKLSVKDKDRIQYRIEERQQLFGKEKNVLEDGFYKGLDKKTRKKLRARGAISGCYEDNLINFKFMNPVFQ